MVAVVVAIKTPLVIMVDLVVAVVQAVQEVNLVVVLHHILHHKVMLEDMHGLNQELLQEYIKVVAVVVPEKQVSLEILEMHHQIGDLEVLELHQFMLKDQVIRSPMQVVVEEVLTMPEPMVHMQQEVVVQVVEELVQ
tara:strand:+ start:115 stop:525 length:411 start_codon:yes stop_codon:yes gene_type:complete